MTPETSRELRGRFSSFWGREIISPVKETYFRWLEWRNQAIGYLGLGKETMALRQGVESRPQTVNPAGIPGTPEHGALRRKLVIGGGLAVLGLIDYARWLSYYAEHGTDQGFSIIPGFDNPPEANLGGAGFSNGSGSTASETPGATPSQTSTVTETATQTPTETAIATQTETPTAGPAATERILDVRHGELPPFSSRDISWEQSMQQLNEHIENNSAAFQSFDWKRSMYPTKETESGVERDGREYQRQITIFRDLTYLGYLDFTYFNERYFNEKLVLFVYRGAGGQQSILPFMALEFRSHEMGSTYVHPNTFGNNYMPMTAAEFVGIAKPGDRADVVAPLSFSENSAAAFVLDKYTVNVYGQVSPVGLATWINLGNTCWGCPN